MPQISQRSDEDLMELIKARDTRAFDELYRRHKNAVYGYCMRIFAGNRSSVDDACQETWMKVVRRAETFQAGRAFKPWVMAIARNESIAVFRKRQPDLSIDAENVPEVADDFDLEEKLVSNCNAEELRQAIDSLPDSQRMVFSLWVEEDASYDSICRQLNLEWNSVRALLYRARQTLRARLEKK